MSNQFNECAYCKKDSSDRRWLKMMKLGEKTGCHQRYDRSFVINNKQFPICARCTGVFIAYIISIVYYINNDIIKRICHKTRVVHDDNKRDRIAFALCLSMLGDWTIQALKIKESTNLRRLITGIFGGFGLMHFYHRILVKIIQILKHKIKE